MSGRIRTAACLIERGERIELEDGTVRVVWKRYNSRAGRTFVYLTTGTRLVLNPLHMLTIARTSDDRPAEHQPSARAEALRRYPDPVDVETGEPVDDWGYAETERRAFLAGAEWQRANASTQLHHAITPKETR